MRAAPVVKGPVVVVAEAVAEAVRVGVRAGIGCARECLVRNWDVDDDEEDEDEGDVEGAEDGREKGGSESVRVGTGVTDAGVGLLVGVGVVPALAVGKTAEIGVRALRRELEVGSVSLSAAVLDAGVEGRVGGTL